jgi:16S rRNA (cytidine1402-2'-O)-methyltransferase
MVNAGSVGAGAEPGAGRLYVVSTPIGNMGDFSFRAVEVLRSVGAILAEDTRHSRPLLERYEVDRPVIAYHEHNEVKSTAGLVRRLLDGEDLALISDAGTPLLSDPGARLVSAALDAGVKVVPVPGASALLAALVASGIGADRFTFYGFLPRSGAGRSDALDELCKLKHTAVLYEAPGRVWRTLEELAEKAPDRKTVVARELTKLYEEVRQGTLGELSAYYRDNPPRGEVVIVLAGAEETPFDENAALERARQLFATGSSVRDIARALASELGASRNQAYRMAQDAASSGTATGGRTEGE